MDPYLPELVTRGRIPDFKLTRPITDLEADLEVIENKIASERSSSKLLLSVNQQCPQK